jgi:hypothetical protein
MLEKHVEAKIVRHCKSMGLLAYKFSSPARRGVPDRLIVGRGKVLFLEVKSAGNKPTTLQLHEMDILNKAGVYATWADNAQTAIEIIDDHFLGEI